MLMETVSYSRITVIICGFHTDIFDTRVVSWWTLTENQVASEIHTVMQWQSENRFRYRTGKSIQLAHQCRQLHASTKRFRYWPVQTVSIQKQRLQLTHPPKHIWQRARKLIVLQIQIDQVHQVSQTFRNAASQPGIGHVQHLQVDQVPKTVRYRAVKKRVTQIQYLQVNEISQFRRKRASHVISLQVHILCEFRHIAESARKRARQDAAFQEFKQGHLVDCLEGVDWKNFQTADGILFEFSNSTPSIECIVNVVLRYCQEGVPKGFRRNETEDFHSSVGVSNMCEPNQIREGMRFQHVVEGAADSSILCDLERIELLKDLQHDFEICACPPKHKLRLFTVETCHLEQFLRNRSSYATYTRHLELPFCLFFRCLYCAKHTANMLGRIIFIIINIYYHTQQKNKITNQNKTRTARGRL
ncbi:hypothetical protein BJ741DRAFT_438318 [Chytriomyces cf. hyalinus JEL632]|nr:hypothetical protein BJ741DRAFT_438318 [Chytriomyces cf. hyalinus JEL632]